MAEILSNLPFPIRVLLMFGGGLVSATAGRLPEPAQDIGLIVGLVALALGCILTGWYLMNYVRAARGRPMLQIEPIHLVALGLVIALIGVAWQFYRGDTGPGLRDPAQAAEAVTIAPKKIMYLSSEDKKRVDDALFKLSDLLNRQLKAVMTESNHLVFGWSNKKMDDRVDPASEIAEMLPKLQTLRTNLKGINDAIVGQLYKEYEDYSEILRDITLSDREPDQQRPIDSFQLRTEEFIRALETFRAAYDPTKVERSRLVSDLLDPRQDAFVSAMHRVNIWIEGCRVRIADTKKAYNL